jgi:hypothetical protein
MDSKAAFHINSIIFELKEMAIAFNFKIRVIRGTFTHDRYQNRLFLRHGESSGVVKVFQKPDIEYIKDLGVWIMYKPDDLPQEDVQDVLNDMLKTQHINSVDILINHGYFDYMVPMNMHIKPHGVLLQEKVESIVSGFILNGHVHTPSINGKIISGGSFERFKFGEEESKGFFIIDYDIENKTMKYEFIENHLTPIYKTIDLLHEEDPISIFKKWISETEFNKDLDINIRVIIKDKTLQPALGVILNNKYRQAKLSIKSTRNEDEYIEPATIQKIELPILTPDNLSTKIQEYIKDKFQQSISLDSIDKKMETIK